MKYSILAGLAFLTIAAIANAQDCPLTALMTTVVPGSTIPCRVDPCNSTSEIASQPCPEHCFQSPTGEQCFSKQASSAVEDDTDVSKFSAALDDSIRFLQINQPSQGLSQLLCNTPKFPQTCSIDPFNPNLHLLLNSPIDIPYCQRIPCSGDPSLNSDRFRCHSNPGCYYDVELANIRQQYGHSIMAGVPVCQKVIRNKIFNQLANRYIQESGQQWNGLQESCFLRERIVEINQPDPGCYPLDVLRYIGVQPKLAGWQGINEQECILIGGCASSMGCHYPSKLGQIQIRSGSDPNQNSFLGSQTSYGQPTCIPFNANSPRDYFDSYTTCLKSGCVLDSSVNDGAIQQQFYILVTSDVIAEEYKGQFWNLVLKKIINPSNWQMQYNQLRNRQTPQPFDLSALFSGLTSQNNDASSLFAFSLSLDNNTNTGRHLANLQTGNGGLSQGFLGGLQGGFPAQQPAHLSGLNQFPGFNQLPGLNQFPGFNQLPAPFQTGLPGFGQLPPIGLPGFGFPGQGQCPYATYGLSLSGRNTDCCEKTLCYIPRDQVSQEYSGEAPYYTQWGGWGACSTTCGFGRRTRSRDCVARNRRDCDASQSTEEEEVCNLKECPVWGPYGGFGACSQTCGGGLQRQTRTCQQGDCEGLNYREQPCNTGMCPTYSQWGDFGPCPVECGEGQHYRQRTCLNPGAYGCNNALSNLRDTKTCQIFCGQLKTTYGDCAPFPLCYQAVRQTCERSDGTPGYCVDRPGSKYQRCAQDTCVFCSSFSCQAPPNGPVPN